jgi:hypothetical protein
MYTHNQVAQPTFWVASIQFQYRFRLPESGVGTVAATSIYPLRRLVLAMRFGQAPRIGSQRSDFA